MANVKKPSRKSIEITQKVARAVANLTPEEREMLVTMGAPQKKSDLPRRKK